ncbi:putative zinc finger protein 286B [Cloeon dipterum]|uniref:putative zinc finger protein 286B n=1 Tax=Cloeon dipterum TaxID=197152 RepID=UPI0032209F85
MAAGYRRANYYELCRLCTSSEGVKVHIFREEGQRRQLINKIQNCLPLQVIEEDSLPNIICMDCVHRLESFYDFRQTCINAEAMLESYYSSLKFNEEFRKTGKCYVKEVPKKREKLKLPLEPLVKPDINITRINTTPSLPEPQAIKDVAAEDVLPTVQIQEEEQTNPRIESVQHVGEVQIHPIETMNSGVEDDVEHSVDNEAVQEFEFIVDDKVKNSDEREEEENETLLMEFNFIKGDKSDETDGECGRTSMDQIGEFLRIKPVWVTPVSVTPVNKQDTATTEASNHCSRCNKTFFDSQLLNEHECGGVQVTIVPVKANLSNLKSNNADEACYICEVCSRPFKRKEHLIQHSKLHTGERPFPCSVCGKTFSRKEHLIRHTTCHTGEKQHECDVCGKSFSRRDNLLKHRKTHGVNGPFVCETCGKTFTMKHYYVMHRATHTNETPERPFKCDKCGKSFAVRQYLLNHISRHRDNPQHQLITDDLDATVKLPSADETAESLADQSNNYVQIVQLNADSDEIEQVGEEHEQDGGTFVQIVSLKEEHHQVNS